MFKRLKRAALGATVPHNKNTAGMPTVQMPLPTRITLVMQQHIGAPCQPAVQKGDRVDLGTVVGRATGFVAADIHSGVSGTVASVVKLVSTSGALVDAVVIEPDGMQTIDPSIMPPVVRDRDGFLGAVRAAGIVGLGGAGFPTAVKLAPKNADEIDTLIINAAECEPYITADDREMLECGDTILSGIKATLKFLDIPNAVIAVERNKPEAMDLMFSLTKGDTGLSVIPLTTRYPQGAEKVLIESVTGREVPEGGLPADVGVIVMNVTTVSAIGKYLTTGIPLVTKRLTVDGGAVATPQNVEVVVGTPIKDILDFCGFKEDEAAKVLCGGLMMGVAMADLSYPVIKQNNALLALTAKQAALPPPAPCIRCARCVYACPMGLSPIEITEGYELRDLDTLHRLHADNCISCGCCSFVCPAKRLVSQTTTLARAYYGKEVKKLG